MAEGRMPSGHNRLLMTLPPEDYRQITPHLERISLGLRAMLYESRKPIEYVYFPIDGVMSMLAEMEENSLVEVATVGNEGMVGLPLFLGASITPGQAFSQVPGEALRMTAEAFIDATNKSVSLARLLHRYTQALMIQISQGTACNRVHEIEQRCARWLLLTHDRVGADEFLLTQEFLGQMLGVRRATVNNIAVKFQQAGYIEYVRGRIRIRNRRKLEAVSCRCYSVIRDEYDRMLGGKTTPDGRKTQKAAVEG
jgi:CRP-like cAMP-binding protein